MGTQQSGVLNLQIADIVKDRDLIPSKTSCVKNITVDVAMQLQNTLRCVLFTMNLLRKKYMELH
jgi:RecG-like helicase